jgi:hypothetical protein
MTHAEIALAILAGVIAFSAVLAAEPYLRRAPWRKRQ